MDISRNNVSKCELDYLLDCNERNEILGGKRILKWVVGGFIEGLLGFLGKTAFG